MTDTKKDKNAANADDAPAVDADEETESDQDLEAAADDFLRAVDLEETEADDKAGDKAGDEAGDEAAEDGLAESLPPTYEELQEQVASLQDQLLRALAEADNTRRRTAREKTDMSKYAVSNFARSVLSVADNLRRALDSVSQDDRDADEALNTLCIGVEMTEKELDTSYEQFGIKTIDAEGKRFDHNLHQAMFEIKDPDQPAGMVLKVMQKGYVIHDRLLRPAMVGVSKGGPKLEKETPDEAQDKAQDKARDKSGDKPGDKAKDKPKPAPKRRTTSRSKAYEKQSNAADQEADDSPGQVDKEL